MAFQGSLAEIYFPDIIQLVSVSGKTGVFHLVDGPHKGQIYLFEGRIVHALAIWNQGDFKFEPGPPSETRTITKSNTNLLMEAARRLDEWRVLSKKIPSVEHVPELQARENRHEQITLNPQEWTLITRIDGHRSIADIGRALNISSFDVAKILYGMITSELAVLKKKS